MGSLLAIVAAATALLGATRDAEVVITRDALRLPAGCSVSETTALVTGFLDAFNRGDSTELDRFFAPAGEAPTDFKWYSSGEEMPGWRRHHAVRDRGSLLAYFGERHARRETIQLVSIDIGAGRGREIGIGYVLIRRADDLPEGLGGPLRIAHGKGAIDCSRGLIYVWSMGMSGDATGETSCPTPRGWTPGSPVLACTRGPNARAVAPGLRPAPARKRCGQAAAFRTLREMLTAFNIGNAVSFRSGLAARATFSPAGRPLTPREIAGFVTHRYFRLGEGWTLTRLQPGRGRGRFTATVAVSRLGAPVANGIASISLDCESGLVSGWSGPAVRLH